MLARVATRCGRRAVTSGERTVGTAASCLRFYAFNPGMENDRDRDYGVIWLHATVGLEEGWCATDVRSDLRIPKRTRTHARTPKRVRTRTPRSHTSRLVVDAAGTAERPATISRSFRLFPRVLTGRKLLDRRVFRARWRGSSNKKLALASGIEISWNVEAGPPTELSSVLRFDFVRRPAC